MRGKPLQTTTYGIAIFNMFSAFIYGIAIADKLHLEGGIRVGARIAVIVLFFALEFIPKIVIIPAVAAGFMNIFTAWSLLDHIGASVLRIILKAVTAIILALIELSLFTDVTLEGRDESGPPTIQQLKASGYKKCTKDGVTSYRKEYKK